MTEQRKGGLGRGLAALIPQGPPPGAPSPIRPAVTGKLLEDRPRAVRVCQTAWGIMALASASVSETYTANRCAASGSRPICTNASPDGAITTSPISTSKVGFGCSASSWRIVVV